MKKIIKNLEAFTKLGGTKKDIAFLCISGIALVLSLTKTIHLPFDIAWVAIVLCGFPIILEAIIGLITEFDIKADILVSIALIASVCIGEDFAAGEIAFIMQIGALLEDLTVSKARAGIEKLAHLTPQTARLITPDSEKVIPAQKVKVGDVLRVLPGESIAVDGIITDGETSVNQSVMTGESMPVDKTTGDEVSSGTVNQFGTFEMKATKVGDDSSIQRMIKLVQSADAGKAKIVGLADRWATWIVIIALTAAILTWIISGQIIRAVTILVVFCPCSLVLATPTAIIAAIGNVTKHGFLVRQGDALERLAKVSKVTFDKTGTLTYGKPQVICIENLNDQYNENELFALAAAAEQYSEHPLGKAITDCYRNKFGKKLLPAESFEMIVGCGVRATINNQTISVGNKKLFDTNSIAYKNSKKANEYIAMGCTVILIGNEKEEIGYLVLSDTLRDESKSTIKKIKESGISPVLLTGDNAAAAQSIANQLKIDHVESECLPENKMEYIQKSEHAGEPVCMIGDGINDAPALKAATVGIAMGGIGSDIAVDAADIVLVDDEVKELPHLFALSKKMMNTIKLNLTFSMTLNFIAIILAITGILNPVVGALVHNAGSVLVIINSAMLMKQSKK